MKKLTGIGVSPGIAIGIALVISNKVESVPRHMIKHSHVQSELKRFDEAVETTRKQIQAIHAEVENDIPEMAELFHMHLLILDDERLYRDLVSRIRDKLQNVEAAVWDIAQELLGGFDKIEDPYFRQRKADINDVVRRLLSNLMNFYQTDVLHQLKEKHIIVAHDLSPSETVAFTRSKVIGIATDMGGATAHTAIIAEALEIPAVVGLKNISSKVQTGDKVIVDGDNGVFVHQPTENRLKQYRQAHRSYLSIQKELKALSCLPNLTTDGKGVGIEANIEFPMELPTAISYGASGIGLFRTEFLFLNRNDLPNEEEQFSAYRQAAEKISPGQVIVRTLDIGGDKFVSTLKVPTQINPSLGCRAIRFCLENKEIFLTQLRALLRASAYGNMKIMYPMISGVEEFKAANKVLDQAKEQLDRKKMEFNREVEVGVMIEVPSAAMTADILAQEADFFSIGTNDLIQYTIAIDRVNEKIAYLYEPTHPSVLRLIQRVIDAAHKVGIPVGICGEMAREPAFALLLIGLGIDELSMAPIGIPHVKKLLNQLNYENAREIAKKAMQFTSSSRIEGFLRQELEKIRAINPLTPLKKKK